MDFKVYIILGGALGACAAILLLKVYFRFKIKNRLKRAKKSEIKAVDLLKRHGFEIIDIQKTENYELVVDNKVYTATVKADMIARRNNKIYVIEVKSGKKAPSLKNIATRRQLLEYYLVYQPDGLILVDMEKKKIRNIDFSITKKRIMRPIKFLRLATVFFIIGFVVGFLTRGD